MNITAVEISEVEYFECRESAEVLNTLDLGSAALHTVSCEKCGDRTLVETTEGRYARLN